MWSAVAALSGETASEHAGDFNSGAALRFPPPSIPCGCGSSALSSLFLKSLLPRSIASFQPIDREAGVADLLVGICAPTFV